MIQAETLGALQRRSDEERGQLTAVFPPVKSPQKKRVSETLAEKGFLCYTRGVAG
jgi:hypothetical protein